MEYIGKSLTGAVWIFLDLLLNKSLFFISTVILANIIGPKEFGLVGLITVFFTIGNSLVDSGLSTSLLRENNLNENDYSTVFYLNILFAIVIYLFIYLLSPFVALFFEQSSLEILIKIYCLGFLINSFRIVQNTILIKNLNFKTITLYNVPGNIISFIVSVWMAKNGFKVWSVVALFLINQIISTLIYFFLCDWKPQLLFSKSKAKYHFSFGYKLMLSTQLNIIFDNIYNVLIGKYFDIKTVGFYERAYTLNSYPNLILSSIFSKLSLPLLANISNNKDLITQFYRKLISLAFFVSAPLMIIALVLAKPIFLLILGEEWLGAVPFFQILCIAYMFYPVHSLNINLLSVFGKSDLFLKIEIIKKILVAITVMISFKFGIYALVWSNVLVSVAALYINTYYNKKMIGYTFLNQITDMFPICIISFIMGLILHFLLETYFGSVFEIYKILVISIFGFFIYTILCFIIKNETFKDILSIIKNKSII